MSLSEFALIPQVRPRQDQMSKSLSHLNAVNKSVQSALDERMISVGVPVRRVFESVH